MSLTPRNLAVLRAYARAGSVKLTAADVRVSSSTVRKHLALCRAAANVPTTVQAVYVLLVERAA